MTFFDFCSFTQELGGVWKKGDEVSSVGLPSREEKRGEGVMDRVGRGGHTTP